MNDLDLDAVLHVGSGIVIGMVVSSLLRPKAVAPRDPAFIYRPAESFPSRTSGPFTVIAERGCGNKISDIKAIRACTSLGLSAAKALVDNIPSLIAEDVSQESAEAIRRKLEEAGMIVRIKNGDLL